MWKEFKQFAMRGNLIDLAIGFIIGTAFTKVVTSIVNDLVMPPLGLAIGRVDFSSLYINLSRHHYASFEAAKAADAPTINIGSFLTTLVNFLIIAIVMFLVVRQLNHLAHRRKKEEVLTKPPRTCPYCIAVIPDSATRCPQCTSHLPKVEITST